MSARDTPICPARDAHGIASSLSPSAGSNGAAPLTGHHQLRKRGEAEEAIRSKSILVLGVGTLGAAVAENLLRMGVTRMGLVDDDTMLVANLSRHLLTMPDAGQGKAERMAERLNIAAPDAQVVAMPFAFFP